MENAKVLTALRFYASGSYQFDVGANSYIGVSQPSVSRSIEEVTLALNRPEIFNQWVRFPNNFEELNAIRLRYSRIGSFNTMNSLESLDASTVHMWLFFRQKLMTQSPVYPEHLYVNRKGYHSINVQLIADSNLKIINVCARYPGSTNDAFIWMNSNVQTLLQNLHGAGHNNYFLLGDSGYPLRSWLLTPLEQEPLPNTPEHRYNMAHKSTRSVIERVNGLLKMRFRCCLKHRVLHYVACKIINACVVLHNLCIEHGVPEPEEEDLDPVDLNLGVGNINIENEFGRINIELAQGRAARRTLIDQHFRR
ncbi:hypothetical protein NQ315_013314 [Exocentrus adspersus]|uniref:DDE Tnp4 domain-containing protein n=1 Tax=Exocentrus adspersus TaxID=1586481 RepID=A0AAV8V768_9CUCU|nr:hypothetical protein NQ315_013314 [Exocentrus adspersus]